MEDDSEGHYDETKAVSDAEESKNDQTVTSFARGSIFAQRINKMMPIMIASVNRLIHVHLTDKTILTRMDYVKILTLVQTMQKMI